MTLSFYFRGRKEERRKRKKTREKKRSNENGADRAKTPGLRMSPRLRLFSNNKPPNCGLPGNYSERLSRTFCVHSCRVNTRQGWLRWLAGAGLTPRSLLKEIPPERTEGVLGVVSGESRWRRTIRYYRGNRGFVARCGEWGRSLPQRASDSSDVAETSRIHGGIVITKGSN